jgi:hypothetical protein
LKVEDVEATVRSDPAVGIAAVIAGAESDLAYPVAGLGVERVAQPPATAERVRRLHPGALPDGQPEGWRCHHGATPTAPGRR